MNKIRTTAAMVADLLSFLLEKEWSGSVFAGGDYYEPGCEECGAFRDMYDKEEGRLIIDCKKHKDNCKINKLIEEARSFIFAENQLSKSIGLDEVDIP